MIMQNKPCITRLVQSARGLAHSKTWRSSLRSCMRDSVLECASPLALSRRENLSQLWKKNPRPDCSHHCGQECPRSNN
jgi:hypothetical protein